MGMTVVGDTGYLLASTSCSTGSYSYTYDDATLRVVGSEAAELSVSGRAMELYVANGNDCTFEEKYNLTR
jgi:hypothetical protein